MFKLMPWEVALFQLPSCWNNDTATLQFNSVHLLETTLIFGVPSVMKVLDKLINGEGVSALLPSPASLGQRCRGIFGAQKQHWEERYNCGWVPLDSVSLDFTQA